MTDTNDKETFEDKYLKLIGQINISIQDWEILKKLHDKEIQELQAENEKLKSKLRTCICFKCGSKAINENGFCLDCGCYQ